jgi:hypothetical protein
MACAISTKWVVGAHEEQRHGTLNGHGEKAPHDDPVPENASVGNERNLAKSKLI